MSSVEGLDLPALSTWLSTEQPGLLDGPLTAELIAGGKSNLTYGVSDGTTNVVVRRPPLGHVLATAHDMAREYRVMSALAASEVPVPKTYGLCQDANVLGADFYVMERVPGIPFARGSQLAELGPERTRRISEQLVDVLAKLHAVDPDSIGLGDFGRPDGYLERQVRRWKQQLDASRSRELPGMDDLIARLETTIPQESEGTIVHGDYRLDNLLIDTENQDQVSAVIDWEMSTLGDPLTDVGLLLAYQQMATDMPASGNAVVTDAAKAPGYLTPKESMARYAEVSGRDISDIDFYLAFAFFKLAVVLEGIHLRHSQGKTVGEGFEGIGELIYPLIDAGLNA